jgi:hypothetical protein
MEFIVAEEVWMFWISYGGKKDVEVRKRYTNKRKSDRKVRSCRYVCANEDNRVEDKRDHLTKCPRTETRTNCQVRMGLILDREKGNYKVADLHPSNTTNITLNGVSKEKFRVARF